MEKENIISKDLIRKVYQEQENVLLKFDNIYHILYSYVGAKAFIDKIDKYILQALEEIYETISIPDEFFNPITDDLSDEKIKNFECLNENSVSEITDTIMYLYTLLVLIDLNLKDLELVETEKNYYMNKAVEDIYKYSFNNENISIENFTMNCLIGLLSIRRHFPERKWHKKNTTEWTIEDIYDILTTYKNNIIGCIVTCSNFYYKYSKKDLYKRILKKKSNYLDKL